MKQNYSKISKIMKQNYSKIIKDNETKYDMSHL